MGETFVALGIGAWKPMLTALALPPVPFLLLILVGAWRCFRRPGSGRWWLAAGVAGIWLSACWGSGRWLLQQVLRPPPALAAAQLERLAARVREGGAVAPAIVVLGGGREAWAPEYGQPDLRPQTLMRLRYGLWLAGRTAAPVVFSGGTGWAQSDGSPEAEIAARIAAAEFGRPLAWAETLSRDTRGNAEGTVAWLRRSKVAEAVIVTHAWHMPRALRLFEAAAQGSIRFTAAPVGYGGGDRAALDWMPSSEGQELVRGTVRELLARLLGD